MVSSTVSAAYTRPATSLSPEKLAQIDKAAQDFEAVFISQMLQPVFNTVPTDGFMGGGSAEESWRGLLVDEYGKMLASSGGVGMSDAIRADMIKMQELAERVG